MKVHFVCTSNTFRSRLAESYLNSKKIPGLAVSSSGVEALKDPNGPITWYAQRIIEEEGLVPSEKMMWTQTTKEILESQDLVVFMQKWHYDQCVARFKYIGKNYTIWDVEDLKGEEVHPENVAVQRTEQIYNKIKVNIENLIATNFKLENNSST